MPRLLGQLHAPADVHLAGLEMEVAAVRVGHALGAHRAVHRDAGSSHGNVAPRWVLYGDLSLANRVSR